MLDVRTPNVVNNTRLNEAPIRIIVGEAFPSPPAETFYIDAGVLQKGGDFFLRALKKEWKEGQKRCIKLPIDEPDTFRVYAQWLYTGKLFCKSEGEAKGGGTMGLCEAYTLGDRLMDRVFQDRILDALLSSILDSGEETMILPSVGTVDYVCRNLTSDSPIRRFMLDLVVRCCARDDGWPEFLNNVNQAFLADVVLAMVDKVNGTHEAMADDVMRCPGCRYHHHHKDQPCPAT